MMRVMARSTLQKSQTEGRTSFETCRKNISPWNSREHLLIENRYYNEGMG